jgi:hypothetical protein
VFAGAAHGVFGGAHVRHLTPHWCVCDVSSATRAPWGAVHVRQYSRGSVVHTSGHGTRADGGTRPVSVRSWMERGLTLDDERC